MAASVTSLSWSHTVGTGNNRLLAVTFAGEDVTLGDMTITSVTYNGVAMTLAPGTSSRGTQNPYIKTDIYYLMNPPTGAHTVVISLTGTCTSAIGGAVSLFNVRQMQPDGFKYANAGSATISTSVEIATAKSWIVDVLGCSVSGALTTTGTGMLERWSAHGGHCNYGGGKHQGCGYGWAGDNELDSRFVIRQIDAIRGGIQTLRNR